MILLDSSFLIDVLRREAGVMALLHRLRDAGEAFGTPTVCAAEVLRGANRDSVTLATATRILESLTEVPFGPRAARRFGRIMHGLDKAGRPIPALDGMVAAVVLEEGARLATRDAGHFERVAGLELVVP